MVNLSALNCIEIVEFDNIVNSKHNPRRIHLGVLRPRILSDYNDYNINFNTIHTKPFTSYTILTEKADLLHCYNVNTAALENLIKRIEENQSIDLQHICSYCLYNKIEETDHYIPKEEFAEFCVLASNLVPICSVCNKKKNQYWRTNNQSTRTFLHLYKDIMPNIQFLFGTLNFVNSLPQFNWTISNTNNIIPINLFTIISEHFNKLELADRYQKACNELLAEIERSVKAQRRINANISMQNISNLLIAESIEESFNYGINYWKAIAKNCLANDQQYINSL